MTFKHLMPKGMNICYENLDLFWKFIYERQEIYHKRFVLRQPAPWTEDPILKNHKFTNIYRELDRNTVWELKHIINKAFDDNREQFFQIMIFRLINNPETFEKIGIPTLKNFNKDKLLTQLNEFKNSGINPFTNAYIVNSGAKAGVSRNEFYCNLFDYINKNINVVFHEICLRPRSLKEVNEVLKELPTVGPFIAYELSIDLMYAKLIPFTEDDWVNVGPGCRVGIELIFPNRDYLSLEEAIYTLRDNQVEQFKKLNLDFKYLNGNHLTLRNIEHSLCEFQKYWKMIKGVGKQRSIFTPKTKIEPIERKPYDGN